MGSRKVPGKIHAMKQQESEVSHDSSCRWTPRERVLTKTELWLADTPIPRFETLIDYIQQPSIELRCNHKSWEENRKVRLL